MSGDGESRRAAEWTDRAASDDPPVGGPLYADRLDPRLAEFMAWAARDTPWTVGLMAEELVSLGVAGSEEELEAYKQGLLSCSLPDADAASARDAVGTAIALHHLPAAVKVLAALSWPDVTRAGMRLAAGEAERQEAAGRPEGVERALGEGSAWAGRADEAGQSSS